MGFGEVLREFGVKVAFGFDDKKVDKASDKVEKFAGKLRGFALEAAGVTAGLFAIENSFTSNARGLENQAHLLGINTDKLQEYEYAAKVVGDVNRDELVDSLQKLGDTMDQARAGNVDARKSLEQLGAMSGKMGLIMDRLNDPTYKVTDAFHDMASGIQAISKNSPLAASRIVEQTLGSTKLYNVLREGPGILDKNLEAGRKNFALNEKMVHQGAEMDKQISKLWLTFRKFGYEIGFSVMRHLTPMINKFTQWFAINKKFIASGINAFLDKLADVIQLVWEMAIGLVGALKPVVEYLGGVKNAVSILINAFLAFKAIQAAVSITQMIVALAGIADIIVPMGLAAAAISILVVSIHDLWTVLTGGSYADTWLSKIIAGVEGLIGKIPVLKSMLDWRDNAEKSMMEQRTEQGSHASQRDIVDEKLSQIKPFWESQTSPTAQQRYEGPQESPVSQSNTFNTTNNITLPPGTTAHGAAGIISRANVDSNEKMMIKAKLDAARSKQY
jgi:hypothetical protein